MARELGFPIDLFQQSIEMRRKYFAEKVISHPKLEQAYEEARFIFLESKTPIVFLFGPSGVGKSTLLSKLRYEIITSMKTQMELDKGLIPVVSFESKSPESVKFSWGDYFRSGLMALSEPCIDKKVVPMHLIKHEVAKSSSRDSASTLRWAFESALVNRKPLGCIVDEAQHIAKIPRGSKLEDQMDVIKSISNITKVPHMLSGTYELLRLIFLDLTLRCVSLHLYECNVDNCPLAHSII